MEQIAQQFTDFYYSTFDADRNQLVNLYVRVSLDRGVGWLGGCQVGVDGRLGHACEGT